MEPIRLGNVVADENVTFEISWCIRVDKKTDLNDVTTFTTLYAINENGKDCYGDAKEPYGFAITCVGVNEEESMEDNGATWFRFPLEGTSINDCYDFAEWKKGNFDMTLKETAKTFNINRVDDRLTSTGKKIFEL